MGKKKIKIVLRSKKGADEKSIYFEYIKEILDVNKEISKEVKLEINTESPKVEKDPVLESKVIEDVSPVLQNTSVNDKEPPKEDEREGLKKQHKSLAKKIGNKLAEYGVYAAIKIIAEKVIDILSKL